MHAHAISGGPQGRSSANTSASTGRLVAPALPKADEGMRAAAFGLCRPPRRHPQGDAPSQTLWHAGRYGEVHEVVAPEAYVPSMVDQGRELEGHGSFLGPNWDEEAPEAELFQEPQGSTDKRTDNNIYQVPLLP